MLITLWLACSGRRAIGLGHGRLPGGWFACVWLPVLILSPVLASAARVEVAVAIERLAAQHGFRVDGRQHLEQGFGWLDDGPLEQQLRELLEGFDHIIIRSPTGEVERVLIMGPTTAGLPAQPAQLLNPLEPESGGAIELPTNRRGNQHLVEIALEGAGARRLTEELLIDTGADALVLPASMIARLGLSIADLQMREVQTANGRAQARYGRLPAVWLAGQRVPDVAVAFLEDRQLGGRGLLGMSVLGRFRLTIDDQAHRLLLEPQ